MNGANIPRLPARPAALAAHRRLNRTEAGYPDDTDIGELFDRCVERFPGSVAVVDRDRVVRYRELDRMADALARRLHTAGVRPGAVVGTVAERSPELLAGLLAILRCGATYLPVDAAWPDRRLHELFLRAGCTSVLADRPEEMVDRLPGCRVLSLHGAEDGSGPRVRVGPDAIAYINFTSGSTGRPKGVPIRHRSVADLISNASYAPLDHTSVLLQLAPVTFDAATFEIWGALLHGGTCVLHPPGLIRASALKRLLDRHGVTVLFLTTALFNAIVDEAPETLDGVGTVLTGGEAHSPEHIRVVLERLGPDRLVSVYGPTECTTFATCHPVRELRPDTPMLPIGTPIQNTRAYLVGEHGLCAPGETGEVLLAGPGLSPGYLGMPDETARRFVHREIGGEVERLYRTGDRAYLRDDGVLVFQGRTDDQVKINGHRIELGEIAHHLDRHPDVRQHFVTVRESRSGEKTIIAFVVPRDDREEAAAVREYLRARLPGPMVPGEIRILDALPLSETGKVDRRALLAEERPAADRPAADRPADPDPDEPPPADSRR